METPGRPADHRCPDRNTSPRMPRSKINYWDGGSRLTRPLTASRSVTFGAACRACPLRARCTTAKDGRQLQVHEHDALQREHRLRAQDPTWQDDYRQHRPMVERSIAWLTAKGNRKLRYRGVTKNNAWLHHRTAALNLRRLLNLGLTHHHGTWILA